ncbi:Transcription factor BEE 3, partial [Cucurbita argyrosperma subsp. sororia]
MKGHQWRLLPLQKQTLYKACFGRAMGYNDLEMISNHFTVESSNESDHYQGTIMSSANPFFTNTFCFEKFDHFNEIPSCVIPAAALCSSVPPNYSSFPAFHTDGSKSSGGRKRKRENERDEEKPKGVIHVRAKRGQATDSHSLAERFLSMKLSVASRYYDFNNSSETDEIEIMQVRTIDEGSCTFEFCFIRDLELKKKVIFEKVLQATNGCGYMEEMGGRVVVREEEGNGGSFYHHSTLPPL